LGWEANRILACGEPADYFRLGAKRSHIGAQVIRDRLSTHLIPVDALSVGGYANIDDPDDRAEKIRVDYQSFLRARAELMMAPMYALCEGRNWPKESLPKDTPAVAEVG
jgi:hypothetical protein